MGLFTVYLSLLNIFKNILEYFLENMAGRYWPVFICLQNIFLKYFWIFLKNMGGRYGRVYLGLLGINVLHKFLGFLVDAEICQMDKVVRNVLRVVWIRLRRKPVCQLLLLEILLDCLLFFMNLASCTEDCKLKLALLLQSSRIVCFSIDFGKLQRKLRIQILSWEPNFAKRVLTTSWK